MKIKRLICFIAGILTIGTNMAKEYPCLILTQKGVKEINQHAGKTPLFDRSLKDIKTQIDLILDQPMQVPIPKDAGGGATHERHKKNYTEMYQAGILFQVYKEAKYANFVTSRLKEYAKLYPTLPLHPVQKSNYRGKLFWQGLNDCVWLVYVAQAYDCVYTFLSAAERKNIEQNLFYPMVKFISEDNKQTFNKIHNHATWAVAGVGMIGYVMNDTDLVQKALFGLDKKGKSGFMKQIDKLYSPDGYFTEGPYYQRYSLQPFIVFAQAIQNNEPERNIFAYRDSIFVKAVHTSLQMAYTDGQFFHLNDALDKTWHSTELVYGVDIAYNITKNKNLLTIAKEQGTVILADAGIATAAALKTEETAAFKFNSTLIRDGAEGTEGGIAIFRMGQNSDQTCLVFKATAQGMGHGHFDKLSISFYDNGHEIIQDYGSARFLNIEPKNGGHYLPENDSWAKQTIAHNTLVVDETSHYEGKLEIAENYHPTITRFVNKPDFKLATATEANAYKGVQMTRTVLMVQCKGFEKPIVVDFMDVKSTQEHQYDLPFYYLGQVMNTSFQYQSNSSSKKPLGSSHGYQYLWDNARGFSSNKNASMTFLLDNRFYTLTTTVNPKTSLHFNQLGANDPNFNLRTDPAFMIREQAKNRLFVSVIEPHGEFNPRQEYTIQPYSNIKEIAITAVESNSKQTDYTLTIETVDRQLLTINTANESVTIKPINNQK